MGTLPFVSLEIWTLIFQILNLLILFWAIKRFLFKPVLAILDKRNSEISQTYDKAAKAKSEAESMRADYEKRLAAAKQEAGDIVKSATQKAQMRSEEIVHETQRIVMGMKEKAEADIAQERRKALNEVKDEIGGIAIDIASKVVEREVKASDHEALIREFIKDVGEAS